MGVLKIKKLDLNSIKHTDNIAIYTYISVKDRNFFTNNSYTHNRKLILDIINYEKEKNINYIAMNDIDVDCQPIEINCSNDFNNFIEQKIKPIMLDKDKQGTRLILCGHNTIRNNDIIDNENVKAIIFNGRHINMSALLLVNHINGIPT